MRLRQLVLFGMVCICGVTAFAKSKLLEFKIFPTDEERIQKFVAEVMSFEGKTMKTERMRNVEVSHSGMVTYRDPRFIGYKGEKVEKYSQPTPTKKAVSAGVYDIQKRRRWMLKDLLSEDSLERNACDPVLIVLNKGAGRKGAVALKKLETYEGRRKIISLLQKNNFYFSMNGVTFCFGDGDISPKAIDVAVPWTVIRPYLRDDSLFAYFSDKE